LLTLWNDWNQSRGWDNTPYHSGSIQSVAGLNWEEWNTFLIRWLPDRVEWWRNGTRFYSQTQAHP
jgi:hypothetical protein